jgi:hypothetical protein
MKCSGYSPCVYLCKQSKPIYYLQFPLKILSVRETENSEILIHVFVFNEHLTERYFTSKSTGISI